MTMGILSQAGQHQTSGKTATSLGLLGEVREIVSDLWHARDLLAQLTLRDIRLRYKQAVMGFAWAILMPMLIVMAGFIVRFAMARVSGGEVDASDLAGIAVKSLPWAFFVGAIGFATTSLTANMNLVSKIYFPREVLPLAAVFAQGFDTLIGSIALALLLPFLGAQLSLNLLWVPVLAVTVFVFTAAAALILSCANLFFRDVKYIVQVVLMFGIFFTPVFFDPAMFGSRGAQVVMLNPLAPLLEGLRLSVVEGHNLLTSLTVMQGADTVVVWSPWLLLYSSVWAFLGLAVAAITFHKLQFLFAEYV